MAWALLIYQIVFFILCMVLWNFFYDVTMPFLVYGIGRDWFKLLFYCGIDDKISGQDCY